MKVNNTVWVVTGSGNGMGRAMALALLHKGAKVAAVDLNEAALHETRELAGELQDRISLHVLNITDRAAAEALPDQLIDRYSKVDGLINNAGIIQPFVRINDLDYAVIEKVLNVNFYGLLYMTKAFLPHLLLRPEAHIVNISSMGGFLPVPGQSIYGATKAGVKLMTEGLRAELSDTHVHVTVVFPGAMETNIIVNSGAQNPDKPLPNAEDARFKPLSPAKAAQIILKGIEKNKSRIFVGKDSRFLDWMYRLSPSLATNLVAKQIKAHDLIE